MMGWASTSFFAVVMPRLRSTKHALPRHRDPEAVGGGPGERLDDGDVGDELGGETVPLLEEARAVVAQPHLAGVVLPDEDLERKVDRAPRRGDHERRPRPRIPEDEELGRSKRQPDLGGLAAVVDDR